MEHNTCLKSLPKILKKRKSSLYSQSKKPKDLVASVIEESKRLEYLNRKISNTDGKNMLKHLSNLKKPSSPPLAKQAACFSSPSPYDLLKIPNASNTNNQVISENFDNYLITKSTNRSRLGKAKENEFAEVKFKYQIWSDHVIITDELLDAMKEKTQTEKNNLNLLEHAFSKNIGKVRVKSRIGEYSRKFTESQRRTASDTSERTAVKRVNTPWTYSSNHYTCIFNPKLL